MSLSFTKGGAFNSNSRHPYSNAPLDYSEEGGYCKLNSCHSCKGRATRLKCAAEEARYARFLGRDTLRGECGPFGPLMCGGGSNVKAIGDMRTSIDASHHDEQFDTKSSPNRPTQPKLALNTSISGLLPVTSGRPVTQSVQYAHQSTRLIETSNLTPRLALETKHS